MMNKFNRKMVDSMLGRQDERERLETYERMAVCYAYLYWGSILVGLGSWGDGLERRRGSFGVVVSVGFAVTRLGESQLVGMQRFVVYGHFSIRKNHAGNGQRYLAESFEKFFNFFRRLLCHDFCNNKTEKSRSPQSVNFVFCGIDIFVYGGRFLLQRGHEGEKGLARATA